MELKSQNAAYGATTLRAILGFLFIVTGLNKLSNPGIIISMLGDLGFRAPAFLGWILLLSEIVFGISVLIGYKIRYTVWPLVFILAVATLRVYLPQIFTSPMGVVNVSFHLLGIGALVSLFLTGDGKIAFVTE